MDPFQFLEERDHFRIAVQQAIAAAANELRRKQDLERAQLIANEIGKMLAAGLKKKG